MKYVLSDVEETRHAHRMGGALEDLASSRDNSYSDEAMLDTMEAMLAVSIFIMLLVVFIFILPAAGGRVRVQVTAHIASHRSRARARLDALGVSSIMARACMAHGGRAHGMARHEQSHGRGTHGMAWLARHEQSHGSDTRARDFVQSCAEGRKVIVGVGLGKLYTKRRGLYAPSHSS